MAETMIRSEKPNGYIFVSLDTLLQADQENSMNKAANYVKAASDYISGDGNKNHKMLKKSVEDIHDMEAAIFVLYSDSKDDTISDEYDSGRDYEFAGFMGAAPVIEHEGEQKSEIGSMYVAEAHRKKGIGHAVMHAIVNELTLRDKPIVPYIFTNASSEPIARSVGFEDVEDGDIPPEAYNECSKCWMKIAKKVVGLCCDVQLIYRKAA